MPQWLLSFVGWVTKNAAWLVSKEGLGFLFGGIGLLALPGLIRLAKWLWHRRKARQTARFCNLPGRNKVFTGRAKMLKKLRKALRSRKRVAITQVIEGLGGVGKTQLAIEYGHRHAGEYGIRWLIRAETQQQAKIDLVQLGVVLDRSLADVADLDQQVTCTLQLLNNAKSALLIYDNVERPSDLRELCPAGAGHVLITSRYRDWPAEQAVSLETFSADEALKYLGRRGLRDSRADLAALARRLGYLPLGLAMAAEYMLRQHVSAGEYLGEYEGDQARVLAAAPLPQDYDQDTTLAAVFERSFAAAGERDPMAMELLESLAFLAPDDIPVFVLDYAKAYPREHVSAELAEALGDERQRRELASVLADYSLVTWADDTLSIHRLTRDVLKHRLAADDGLREQRLYAAIELVNAHVPSVVTTNVEAWLIMDALTPHIRALREAMADVSPADSGDPWPRLLNQFGLHCRTRAEFAEAKACFERALEIDEAVYGPEHPEVATDVNNLGGVLEDMGDPAGARECFERALKIDEAVYGPDHPKVAIRLNNLGAVLQEMGDLAGAKECYERAVKIDEAVYGPDHPEVATDVNNLGSVLNDMGDLPGAKECFERVRTIFEVTYGAGHPNVATVVNNLGVVLGDMGDKAGEKACYERALKIDEAAYGPDHPDVARDVNNLGSVLVEMGKFAEARPHLERAVAIWTDKLGPEHPSTQTAMGWLERVRREMAE